jgi:ATP-binding cassette subfamily B protein
MLAAYEEQEFHQKLDLSAWKRMFRFVQPYRKNFMLVIALILFSALVDIVLPLFQRYAVNTFIQQNTLEGLGSFALAYVGIIAVQTVGVIFFSYQSMYVEMNVNKDLKRAVFTHLQTLSFSYYNVTPVGYLLSRVMSDTNRISGMIAWGMIDILWALAYVVGVLGAMFALDAKLALVVSTVVPFIALLTWYFQSRMLSYNRKIRQINSHITGAFNEGIVGAKTSKTLVIEDQNFDGFSRITDEMYGFTIKNARLSGVYISTIVFFSAVVTALVLVKGGYLVMEDAMALGTLSAFTTYAVGIFEPIQQLARNFADVISLQANIERVTDLLDREPDIVDSPEVVEKYGDFMEPTQENWEEIRGDIEFRDVSFRYPDGQENVLEHFNLKISAGTNVAIVGETGAGKSTLVNLACRFFEPTEGQILIDGRDYRERSQLWLHSNIGYVLQSPHLFSGSVMENIRYGRLEATDEEVISAAKSVSADLVVDKLEQGYDSDVGESGDRLSTGEKQLISFARAVLADPRIFVLDEATSSIDTQTEQLIQNAIAHLLQGRTSFVIAHRLSTIRQADLILVVKDGKIIEQGTHAQLMGQRGYYFTLYSKQFEEEAAMRTLDNRP